MNKLLAMPLILLLLCVSSAAAQTPKISPSVHKKIVEQMIREGELTKKCVDEAGGYDAAVYADYENYNRDKIPEIVVMEKSSCIGGNHIWIYGKFQGGYRLIFGPVEGDVLKQKTLSNGYYDLSVTVRAGFDKYKGVKYRFDGQKYKERK